MLTLQKLGHSARLLQLSSYFDQFSLSLAPVLTRLFEVAFEYLLRVARRVRLGSGNCRCLFGFHACGALVCQDVPHAFEALLQTWHCLESKQPLRQVGPCGFCCRTLGRRIMAGFIALRFHPCESPGKLCLFCASSVERERQILDHRHLSRGFEDEINIGLVRDLEVRSQLTHTPLDLRHHELQHPTLKRLRKGNRCLRQPDLDILPLLEELQYGAIERPLGDRGESATHRSVRAHGRKS